MSRIWNYMGIVLVIVITITLLWKSIEFYIHLKKPVSEVVRLIPENTLGYLSIHDFSTICPQIQSVALQNTLDILFPQNKFHEGIQDIKTFSEIFPFFNNLLKNNYICFSFHHNSQSCSLLNLIKAENLTESDLDKYFEKQKYYSIVKIKLQDQIIYELINSSKTHTYFTLFQSVILISKNKSLIDSAIQETQNENHFSKREAFQHILNTTGKNVPANLFLNLKNSASNLQLLNALKLDPKGVNTWLSFDLYPDNQNINGNGYLFANNSFFRSFRGNNELAVELPEAITKVNPASLFTFSLTGIEHSKKNDKDQIPDAFYEGWIGNTGWLFSFENQGKLNWITAVECMDSLQFFQKFVNLFPELELKKMTSNSFMLSSPVNLLSSICNGFLSLSVNCLHFDEGILYLASDQHEMDDFWNIVKQKGNILSGTIAENNVLYQARIYPYQNKHWFPRYLPNYHEMTGKYPDSISMIEFGITGREESLLQINFSLSSLCKSVAYEVRKAENTKVVEKRDKVLDYDWKVSLDQSVESVYMVNNLIMIQGKSNKLIIVDTEGEIMGEIQLDEKIVGQPVYLTTGERNKGRYVVNTSHKLYRFNEKGEFTINYPKQLPKSAISGFLALDYDKNSNYRLIYYTNDYSLYCITLDGKVVPQFSAPKLESEPINIPEHIVSNNKDYLIARDTEGKSYFFDRKGKVRLIPTLEFIQRSENRFYTDKLNLQCCDIHGNIVRVDENGITTRRKPDFPYSSPVYLYAELDNNDQPEHIFAARNLIRAFNERKKLFFECVLPSSFNISEIYAFQQASQTLLLAYSKYSNKVIEINSNGETSGEYTFSESSKPYFSIFDKKIFIIFYSDKDIYCKKIYFNS